MSQRGAARDSDHTLYRVYARNSPLADVVELHAPSTVSWAPDATGGLNRVPNPRRELDTGLPGFGGYYLIDAGNGVLTSVSFFDTPAHADESSKIASGWVREQKMDSVLPNAPKITSGEIVVHETRELVKA
jgi:hypothetical protein